MATPSREIGIVYAGYSVTKTDDVHIGIDGPDISSIKFDFEIADPNSATFAGLKAAAETAFRTPRQACVITVRGQTWKSFSHASGTGFNSVPKIESQRHGRSANSIIYTVKIDFGRPADVYGTAYRRNSTVRITWTPDRRMHMEVDGVYTCNGSTAARAQYLASIGAYADAILTALGGSFDLLEENVVNDDQNKVASFHRKYDEQRDGRNEATIVVETTPNGRHRVTISGTYSTILLDTSSRAAYDSLYPTFKDTVLGAVTLPAGASFEETTTSVESNDTDLVTTFTNVYDQVNDGRQVGTIQIIYSTDRRISVFFYADYFTGESGVDALALARADFPSWATSYLSSAFPGVAFNKTNESYQPNDVSPPNFVTARMDFLEAYTDQGGRNVKPHSAIRDQNYTVKRITEAPGDYDIQTKRMVELVFDYTAKVDHTISVDLDGLWESVKNWLINNVVSLYQSEGAGLAVMSESPDFNPDNNVFHGVMTVVVPPTNVMLYAVNVACSFDPGKVFDGVWSGVATDFHVYDGHSICIAKISKTYRRVGIAIAPAPELPAGSEDLKAPRLGDFPSSPNSGHEGSDDPFGFDGHGFNATVISAEQPVQSRKSIGINGQGRPFFVIDTVYTCTVRYTTSPSAFTQ